MQRNETQVWQRWNRMLNALLAVAVCLILAQVAWGLDTQDIVVEWTPEGKQLARQRVAERQPMEERSRARSLANSHQLSAVASQQEKS